MGNRLLLENLEPTDSHTGCCLALEFELLVEIHRIFKRDAFFSGISYADDLCSIMITLQISIFTLYFIKNYAVR